MTRRRIHIVGSSPRTGTTLLAELMVVGFEIPAFAQHERSIWKPPHVRCDTYLSKNPQDVLAVGRLLRLDPGLWVLHLVRDPRDVVVSRHDRDPGAYWTTLRLWHYYHAAGRRLRGAPRVRTIRYEDLVRDPDAVQDEIAGFLPFLKRRAPFSSFERLADPPPRSLEALGGVRAVETSRIGAWRRHKPRLAAQLARHRPIDRDLRELGYETDGGWKRELEGVAPDDGRSHLAETLSWRLRAAAFLRRERNVARYRRRLRKADRREARRRASRPLADPGPFRTQQVPVDADAGTTLEVGVLGDGPPVLLIPGLGLPGTEEFARLGPALARAGFCAIALNPRGVGRSRGRLDGATLHDAARDALCVLSRLCGDHARAHVVGRGYGNRVARCLAADAPARVDRVALLAAGGRFPPIREGSRRTATKPVRRWQEVRRAQKAASDATPLEDWWDGGNAPTLVIQGLADTTAPPENGRRLAQDHPDRVVLLEIPDAGHELLREHAAPVIRAVLGHLSASEPRAEGRGAPGGASLTPGTRSRSRAAALRRGAALLGALVADPRAFVVEGSRGPRAPDLARPGCETAAG